MSKILQPLIKYFWVSDHRGISDERIASLIGWLYFWQSEALPNSVF